MNGATHASLGERSTPEVPAGSLLAVPLGSCEQHGPHLPIDTDTRIAVELCRRLSAVRADVLVAPALAYGSSGEHAGFPGTLSIGDTLETLLIELARSADLFAGIVWVNGHGGNVEQIRRASARLHAEGRDVLAWSPRLANGDAHAGRTETSVMLALDPARVRLERAEAGDRRPIETLMPALRAGGVRAVSPNGVLGDPAGATAADGARLLDGWATDLCTAVDRWRPR